MMIIMVIKTMLMMALVHLTNTLIISGSKYDADYYGDSDGAENDVEDLRM